MPQLARSKDPFGDWATCDLLVPRGSREIKSQKKTATGWDVCSENHENYINFTPIPPKKKKKLQPTPKKRSRTFPKAKTHIVLLTIPFSRGTSFSKEKQETWPFSPSFCYQEPFKFCRNFSGWFIIFCAPFQVGSWMAAMYEKMCLLSVCVWKKKRVFLVVFCREKDWLYYMIVASEEVVVFPWKIYTGCLWLVVFQRFGKLTPTRHIFLYPHEKQYQKTWTLK